MLRLRHWLREATRSIINGAPLLAALLAPFATLYDIPALSQPWYTLSGQTIQDPIASLVLSAVSLACSIAANSLLALRFCVRSPERWRHATTASAAGWVLKTSIGVANLITFGATKRNGAAFAYDEGFWCAVMSTILSGIASLLLVIHLLDMLLRKHQRAPGQLHLDGRIFLFAEMTLVALIALQALVFSRIEHWTYLDGLYFSVVSLLTIGFGDYSPSTTAGRIVLFPFVITGFALLANQISLIVSISSRNTRRYRQQLQALEEATIGDLASMKHVDDGGESYLRAEARRLRRVTASQRSTQDLLSLSLSLSTLVAFWLTTAGIYTATDGWTFGDSLYFSYIAFFTIGYGDFSPSSPAGKTVFVFWAMVAVPVVTNFVVTAIQTIVTHFSRFLTSRTREKREEWEGVVEDYFVPHPRLVREARERLEELRNEGGEGGNHGSKVEEERTLCESCVESQGGSRDDVLIVSRTDLRTALELSLLLESRGRDILIEEMKAGSTEWLLLQADRNVQERYLSDVGGREDVREERRKRRDAGGDGGEVLLDRIAEYRRTYARWLVMGGRLLRLDGEGLREWERRRDWRRERKDEEGGDDAGKEA